MSTVPTWRTGDSGDELGSAPTLADVGKVVAIGPTGKLIYVPPSGIQAVVIVDPGNPGAYATIQAAIDANVSSALAGGVLIEVAPFLQYTENLTVPAGKWQIVCGASARRVSLANGIPSGGAELVGTVTFSAGDESSLLFRNFRLSSTITATVGASSADGASLFLENTTVVGAITSTVGPGFLNFFATGQGGVEYSLHELSAAVTVTSGGGGFLQVTGYRLGGDLSGFKPEIQNCAIASGVDITDTATSSPRVSVFNCVGTNVMAVTFTASNGVLRMDRQSAQFFVDSGSTLAGPGTPVLDIWDASRSIDQTLTNNSAATNLFGAAVPAGLYEVSCAMVVLVAGTAGAITANVLFTDAGGAATLSINTTPLSVTAAPGRGNGSRQFQCNGSTNVQWSTTGVTTAGSLSYRIQLVGRRLD